MSSGLKHLSELAEAALAKCQRRKWKRDWVHGGSYLHLESSEFMEALRGKRTKSEAELIDLGANEAECEAADVLFVLLSMLEAHAIPIDTVLGKLQALCVPVTGREPRSWSERVCAALSGSQPIVLYHATTPKKLKRYQNTGAILPPVRGFDTLEAAMEWARLTNGRSIILRIEVQHTQALPDHHNQFGLAWWSPMACTTWEIAK